MSVDGAQNMKLSHLILAVAVVDPTTTSSDFAAKMGKVIRQGCCW
jgi:hypothetical protein